MILTSLAGAGQCPTYTPLPCTSLTSASQSCLLTLSTHNALPEEFPAAQEGGQEGSAVKLMPQKQLAHRWEWSRGVNTPDSSGLSRGGAGTPYSLAESSIGTECQLQGG